MKLTSRSLAIFGATGVIGFGVTMLAQDSSGSKMKAGKMGADSHFVAEAASGGMAEVELGKLATQKGSSEQVKQFGQKMVDDHSKANDELKSVAQQENITVPSDMNAKDKATIARLSALSGAAFDKAYVKDMVADHKKDVAAFQKEASAGKDTAVKGFASKTLPTLQEHLKMIQGINTKM